MEEIIMWNYQNTALLQQNQLVQPAAAQGATLPTAFQTAPSVVYQPIFNTNVINKNIIGSPMFINKPVTAPLFQQTAYPQNIQTGLAPSVFQQQSINSGGFAPSVIQQQSINTGGFTPYLQQPAQTTIPIQQPIQQDNTGLVMQQFMDILLPILMQLIQSAQQQNIQQTPTVSPSPIQDSGTPVNIEQTEIEVIPKNNVNVTVDKLSANAGGLNTLIGLNRKTGEAKILFGNATSETGSATANLNLESKDDFELLLINDGWKQSAVKNAMDKDLKFEGGSLYSINDDGTKTLVSSKVLRSKETSADGVNHAQITTEENSEKVAFEDLWGGGDRDYNDLALKVNYN